MSTTFFVEDENFFRRAIEGVRFSKAGRNPADGSRGIVQVQPAPRLYEVGLEVSTNCRWEEQIKHFEQHYQMDFNLFNRAWDEDKIADKHSYEVQRDYWEWEAAITNRARLEEMLDSLA
jgi:hypothetical protein